jgi:hypothetical protein
MCSSPVRRKTSELEGEEYTSRLVPPATLFCFVYLSFLLGKKSGFLHASETCHEPAKSILVKSGQQMPSATDSLPECNALKSEEGRKQQKRSNAGLFNVDYNLD